MGRRTAEAVVAALGGDGGAPDTTSGATSPAVTPDAGSAPTSHDGAAPGMLGA